jgi:alpha-tubulin suppressor-like RCC1 family protein
MKKGVAWVLAMACLSCEAVLGIAPLPAEDAGGDAMIDGASDVATSDATDAGSKEAGDACAMCGSMCVDTQTDPNNCGSCGHTCGDAGYGCVNGGCGNEVVDLAMGYIHACAVLRGGEVWCWGDNSVQQCGGPGGGACPSSSTCRVPTKVAGIKNAVSVGCAYGSSCAADATGDVFCWGSNTNQELGNDGGTASSPIQVALPAKVTQVAGGFAMMCAVTVAHDLYCWGLNQCNSMGLGFEGASDGGYSGNFAPQLVMSGVTSVRTSYPNQQGSTCAAQVDGGVKCWGFNVYDALGHFSSTASCGGPSGADYEPLPEYYQAPGTTIVSPGLTTCAIAAGNVYCSGQNNGNGSLGNGDTSSTGSTSPTIASTLPSNKTFVDVASGGSTACALASTGEVYCWGAPAFGDLGMGYDDAGAPPSQDCAGSPCWPTATRVGTIHATMVRAGGAMAYAVDDGGVWAWGWNRFAQLGHAAGTNGDHVDDAGINFNGIPTRVALP